jgi:selenocysteine-specific elongation factor
MSRSLAVVGTAGHIDHGKTALVRRLTGVDTDRLKEEKERGISIDLGFAPLVTPKGRHVGIVDVPGHERFVRNMLAGVGGIDVVLLVVAADEGVMPQTREHFAIIKLLDIPRGLIVLTKSDLVETEWLAEVEGEVRELVRGSFLESAPIVPFSAVTGAGSERLLAELDGLLEEGTNRPESEPARLPVDRVFTVEGFGTVVTGTLWRGRIAVGDTVAVEPGAQSARVRSVQVHGESVPAAMAGQRSAVALHGLSRQDLARGDWVLAPGSLEPSSLLTVRLDALDDLPKPIAHRARVRFHLGAGEALGRIVLLEGEELAPGDSAFAQLRLETPVVAARGDRFVLRAYSPMRTIGGGTVLEPVAERRRRGELAGLAVTETGSAGERTRYALAEAGSAPQRADELAKRLGADAGAVAGELKDLVATGAARVLPDGRVLAREGWASARERVIAELGAYGKAYPLRWGPTRGELKSRLARALDGALFDATAAEMLDEGSLVTRGDRVAAAPGRELTGRYAEAAGKVRTALDGAGFAPPEAKELLALSGLPAAEATELLGRLLFDGTLVRLDAEFVWGRKQWQDAVDFVRRHFERSAELAVGDVKDGLGVSRKYAVPLLEALDREGVTRREGNVRKVGAELGSRQS